MNYSLPAMAASGVQTAGYNSAHDDKVSSKDAKRVMLKNVQEAKFKTILLEEPISRSCASRIAAEILSEL